jgi:hypothetical protein
MKINHLFTQPTAFYALVIFSLDKYLSIRVTTVYFNVHIFGHSYFSKSYYLHTRI